MQAVSLGCLFVDDFLQFCQIAGTCADKFFFQGNLQHNILVADAEMLAQQATTENDPNAAEVAT